MNITGIVRLLALIVRKGRFRHTGVDYNAIRSAMLADFPQLYPAPVTRSNLKTWLLKNPSVKFWAGQAAFMKNGYKWKPAHLGLPSSDLFYVRIPRAASTAISYSILQARFPELTQYDLSEEKINFLTDANLEKGIMPGNSTATFFTVVRNPFSRIASFYRTFFEQAGDQFIYSDYLFGIFRKDMSFKAFIHTLLAIPDGLKDQHLKPQHTFLHYYHENNIDVRILKVEEANLLGEFFSGYALTLKALNKSSKPYDYRFYYDEETLHAVYRVYTRDILQFGYERDYDALASHVLSHRGV